MTPAISLSLFAPLLAGLPVAQLWYFLPLVVTVSLVWGATRHEHLGPILRHAWSNALWMFIFMGVIFAILWLLSWWL